MWYVYIMLCKDKTLYTGITNNLAKRFRLHKAGKGGRYTRSHKVIRLLYSKQFETKSEALKKEAQIKNVSRKKKLDMIAERTIAP